MSNQCIHLFSRKFWFFIAGMLVIVGILVIGPRKSEVVEAKAVLQGGKKVEVKAELKAPMVWLTPTHLVKLEVSFDGKPSIIPHEVYTGVGPLDGKRSVLIVEKKGFPEIIMQGKTGSSLKEAHWWFQNYAISERRLLKNGKMEKKYYFVPPPPPIILPLAQKTPTPEITLGKESIKKAPKTEGKK